MELTTRYEYGGDEFVFVELSEEMSMENNFKIMGITQKLAEKNVDGVLDICPAPASYMVRIDPDVLDANTLIQKLKEIEGTQVDLQDLTIESRLVDIPVLYEDPWTHEAVMNNRDRHQDPNSTDLEYAARINGYNSKEAFIDALSGSPFLVSMIGFVPGLPFCFQIVPREKAIEVPKYVRPRTFTPGRCFGFGGGFSVIYPVDGAGGYQMFGITPVEVFDGKQELSDFKDSMVFPRQGDILRFRSIDREEYDTVRKQVEDGSFQFKKKDITFKPNEVLEDPDQFSDMVLRRLYND